MVSVKDRVKNLNQKAAARDVSQPGDKPPGPWAGIPMDIMRLVVDKMRPVDVQSTLLVCKEWHDGFASGLLKLKPRALKVDKLAARWAAVSQDTQDSSCSTCQCTLSCRRRGFQGTSVF